MEEKFMVGTPWTHLVLNFLDPDIDSVVHNMLRTKEGKIILGGRNLKSSTWRLLSEVILEIVDSKVSIFNRSYYSTEISYIVCDLVLDVIWGWQGICCSVYKSHSSPVNQIHCRDVIQWFLVKGNNNSLERQSYDRRHGPVHPMRFRNGSQCFSLKGENDWWDTVGRRAH